MKFQGNLLIARPVEKVWEFLWDIERLVPAAFPDAKASRP